MPELMDGTLVVPVAPGDGGEPRAVRRADRHPGPLRLPLDGDEARGRRRTASASSSRRPTASTAAARPSSRSASPSRGARDAGPRDTPPTTPTPAPASRYAGQADLHRRQAELGLRARDRAPAVGVPHRARVAVAGQAVGQHPLARRRPGALRPAVRGPRARRRRVRPRRRDRERSIAAGEAFRVHRPTDRRRRRAWRSRPTSVIAATGFVAPLRDLPDARRRDVRPEPAAGPDAVLGERDACPASTSPGTIAQGAGRAQEARHPVELRRRPRRALQRPGAGAPAARDATPASNPTAADDRAGRPASSFLLSEAATGPELWHQKAYLARVVSVDARGGTARRGHPAARARPRRRRRAGRDRHDARGGRDRRDLPGRLPPLGTPDRGARARRRIRCWSSTRPPIGRSFSRSSGGPPC